MGRLIWIYTVCNSDLVTLLTAMDVSKCRDGRVCVRNSGFKGLRQDYLFPVYLLQGPLIIRLKNEKVLSDMRTICGFTYPAPAQSLRRACAIHCYILWYPMILFVDSEGPD